jgi:hypothetical protein
LRFSSVDALFEAPPRRGFPSNLSQLGIGRRVTEWRPSLSCSSVRAWARSWRARRSSAAAEDAAPGPAHERRPAFLVPTVESVGHAISRGWWITFARFHRWRDRWTVWESSSLVGLPNGLQLFHELVCVGLGFLPCCKRIERCVSHLHVLGNAPSIAARLPGVLCDIDCEDMDLFHTPVMRRRRLHGLGPAHCGSDQALRTLESARA